MTLAMTFLNSKLTFRWGRTRPETESREKVQNHAIDIEIIGDDDDDDDAIVQPIPKGPLKD